MGKRLRDTEAIKSDMEDAFNHQLSASVDKIYNYARQLPKPEASPYTILEDRLLALALSENQ